MGCKLKKRLLLIIATGVIACSMSACGKDTQNTSVDAAQENASDSDEEGEGTQKANNTNGSGNVSGSEWRSANGQIAMMLPNDTWEAETDTEKSISLRSENGTINIVRYDGADMIGMMVPTTEEDYQSMVSGGSGDTSVEVTEFRYSTENDKTIYQGVMHYTNEENPYHYMIHYGIYDGEGGYTATGIVKGSDEAIMETVKESVYSMSIVDK